MDRISRRRFLTHSAVGLFALSQFARSADPQGNGLETVSASNNAFNSDFFQAVAAKPGNVFFSSFSMEAAFAMLAAGARGQTLAQLQRAFHLPEDLTQAHAGFRDLFNRLNDPKVPATKRGYELSVANALWGSSSYPWRKEYLSVVADHYGAGLFETDFNQPDAARQRINKWVEDQTREKIKNLLPDGSISPRTRLVLTNAIYFKGKWELEFDKRLTRDEKFLTASGSEKKVPLMHKSAAFAYGELGPWKALELPYIGKDVAMFVLLPKERGGLKKLQSQVSAKLLAEAAANLRNVPQVLVSLPKFKIESEYDLKPILMEMGVKDVFFEETADLTGMHHSAEKLCVTTAVHKAFVDVNEEGTEAAAATGIVVGVRSAPAEPAVFRADHPFVFALRHKPTNTILFFGKVEDF